MRRMQIIMGSIILIEKKNVDGVIQFFFFYWSSVFEIYLINLIHLDIEKIIYDY